MNRAKKAGIAVMVAIVAAGTLTAAKSRNWKTEDPQVAQGEWKIQVQVPPCDGYRNLQVIWPKEPGAPITIECDAMPVKTK